MKTKHGLLNDTLLEIETAAGNIGNIVRSSGKSLNANETKQVRDCAEAILDRLDTYDTLNK